MLNLGVGELTWPQKKRMHRHGWSKVAESKAAASPSAKTLDGELLDMFANQSIWLTIGIVFWLAMVALISARHVPMEWASAWFAVNTVYLVGRRMVLVSLPTHDPQEQRKRLKIPVVIAAIGAVMQSLPLLIFPELSLVERIVISLLFLGSCTASASAAAGYGPVFYTFIAIALGSLTLAWGLSPDIVGVPWGAQLLALMVATYILYLVGIAKNNFRAFTASYETRAQQRDINRKLSDALAQAESANRAKTRFLASASHDLRQPIHTLSLFSAALSMQQLDAKTREIAGHMNVALETLASQLDALLDVSKLDAGVMEKHIVAFDLRPMLLRLEREFRQLCVDKGLRLECSDFGNAALVESDPALLERVLRNLLSNAVKYTDSGSVYLTTRLNQGSLCVKISDTGRGIPLPEQERVFEEFYQLDNPERDRSKGLGLGLAIVRRLTAMLDIELGLRSQPGEGTSFDLKLPYPGSAPTATPKEAPAPEPQRQAMQVLVIDDEAEVRIGMRTLLDAMGYRVALADSTEQALAQVRLSTPQLVLADFRLRGSDNGVDAIRAIRELVPRVAALLISGDTAPDRLKEAQQAGIKLLHKPVALNALRQAIREVCEHGS